ncbi:MAG: oxidoreductase, partial [Mycobacterium sp.]
MTTFAETRLKKPPTGRRPRSREADIVERIRTIQRLLEKNSDDGEAARRVVEESITALTDAGAFKIAQPRRYGGYETSVRTMLDVSSAV